MRIRRRVRRRQGNGQGVSRHSLSMTWWLAKGLPVGARLPSCERRVEKMEAWADSFGLPSSRTFVRDNALRGIPA